MILSGAEIKAEHAIGRIVISPFRENQIEPNSYGFRIADTIKVLDDDPVDCRVSPGFKTCPIDETGFLLEPGNFYLANTFEVIGSKHYAATLYARLSSATMGLWIQFSAPLGHTGAIIPWTLEIKVAHPTLIYPFMMIGKIAFWQPHGIIADYNGKYTGSTGAVLSRLSQEWQK